jgi:hypothetical protein
MTITYEQIAERAYQIWEREGKPKGRDQEHWTRAEDELRKEGIKKQRGRKVSSTDSGMLKTPRGENL